MTPAELLRFPLDVWSANLRVVGAYIGSYYGWAVLAFVAFFLWVSIRKGRFPELALAAMCVTSALVFASCFGISTSICLTPPSSLSCSRCWREPSF
jgi:hypothetical protein